MPGIDEILPFHPLNIAVLTVSDTRTTETDTSGALLAERLIGAGHNLAARTIVTDDVAAIRSQMQAWVSDLPSISSSPPVAPVLLRAMSRRRP